MLFMHKIKEKGNVKQTVLPVHAGVAEQHEEGKLCHFIPP